ncbi:hypothetical protein GCM10022296_00080 [Secundilactobacillus similis DSM 23365 = JCM 2765]
MRPETALWLRPASAANLVADWNRQFTQITFHKRTSMMLMLDTNDNKKALEISPELSYTFYY